MSEIAEFLIKNNLINETYTDYLVRQSKNGLNGNEKKFLISVLLKDSKELKNIKVLKQEKIYEIFLKLSDHHFSVDNFFNEAIYDFFNKAFYDNNEIIIKGIENYFKKIIFLQDANDPQKITLNIDSISRILYSKLVKPQDDHLFTKMKSYVSDKQISNSRKNDVILLQLILDKKPSLTNFFNIDSCITTLLKRIQEISEETVKQTLEDKLLYLISKKLININSKISGLFDPTNFNNLSFSRKLFYKNLLKNEKISFNHRTYLSFLSILEGKQLDSYKNIYDKLNTNDAKNFIIRHFSTTKIVFNDANMYSQDEADIAYFTSNINSFKSIIEAYRKQDDLDDKEIPFYLINPNILWNELINIGSDISRAYYKEIINALDKDFITEQLNNSSISLEDIKNLHKEYGGSLLNKIKIEALENDKKKYLDQISLKTNKSRSNNRDDKRNRLKEYINKSSNIDDIDERIINKYRVSDLLSIKDSINNKELYIDVVNKRKSNHKHSNNNKKIEKLITELKSE